MRILGIESSCDETAAAVVENGHCLISNVVNSQIEIHSAYGGVVPEVAARSHLEVILPVIDKAVVDAGGWNEIDAIVCTTMPGLIGSLLIGSLTARTLALLKNKPFYPIHHVEAHVYANFINKAAPVFLSPFCPPHPQSKGSSDQNDLRQYPRSERGDETASRAGSGVTTPAAMTETRNDGLEGMVRESSEAEALVDRGPEFPMLALIVSGGHSQIVLFRDHGNYELIGQTQDDAVGEAFDKVAKILGLPYPGGPSIAEVAKLGDPHRYTFPKAKMSGKYDFSFSGLKTAVLRAVQSECGKDHTYPSNALAELLTTSQRNDFAASFQHVAIETLVDKVILAFNEFTPKSVTISGGVAANQELRRQLLERLPIAISFPDPQFCTDNAAMVATLGYYVAQYKKPTDVHDTELYPSISMVKTAWNNVSTERTNTSSL